MVTLGTMHSMMAKPRRTWGARKAANPHSGVRCEVSQRLVAKRVRPMVMTIRWSTVCEARAAMIVLTTWAMPVTKTVVPIWRLS